MFDTVAVRHLFSPTDNIWNVMKELVRQVYLHLYFARNRKSRNKQKWTNINTLQERATQYQQQHYAYIAIGMIYTEMYQWLRIYTQKTCISNIGCLLAWRCYRNSRRFFAYYMWLVWQNEMRFKAERRKKWETYRNPFTQVKETSVAVQLDYRDVMLNITFVCIVNIAITM